MKNVEKYAMSDIDDQILFSIDCIAALFWDYSDDDVHYLRNSSKNIDYVWKAYIDISDDTYKALWKAWLSKFNTDSKRIISEYAILKYNET
ncbi:hypothetical protein [Fibrella forsythiae]|uniref:Uncharacterized protein n=1 Tax=Fibrella forsythiae TaxID=2817061 RepID=A0ABS3JMH6_9BACT|nr:hypothetical protein [Fibrella forsythiae]MBO0950596.1 hypothetical protein [Fibrella forsythiae]